MKEIYGPAVGRAKYTAETPQTLSYREDYFGCPLSNRNETTRHMTSSTRIQVSFCPAAQ